MILANIEPKCEHDRIDLLIATGKSIDLVLPKPHSNKFAFYLSLINVFGKTPRLFISESCLLFLIGKKDVFRFDF